MISTCPVRSSAAIDSNNGKFRAEDVSKKVDTEGELRVGAGAQGGDLISSDHFNCGSDKVQSPVLRHFA